MDQWYRKNKETEKVLSKGRSKLQVSNYVSLDKDMTNVMESLRFTCPDYESRNMREDQKNYIQKETNLGTGPQKVLL